MIKELGELNEKFYQLYGRLHKNKSLLAIKPEQIQYMATALFNQYKAEYKLLAMRAEIREQRELYDAELRHYVLVPRKRFFFFRNRAMKQLDAEILDELEAWFAQRDKDESNGSAQEDLPLGWEEPQNKPESNMCDNMAESAKQPQSYAQQIVTPENQGVVSEQPMTLPEQTRTNKKNAAAQVPGQLSLFNG